MRATKRKDSSRSVKKRERSAFAERLSRLIVPLVLSVVIVFCLGVVMFLGYGTVTASNFFDLSSVAVEGADRASRADIEKIVKSNAERSGVWNADLLEIKQKIEKVPFVKTASVSRSLPTGISVRINERIPVAVVRTSSGEYLADAEGEILAPANDEKRIPFAMTGWNDEKSERAGKENVERLKMYQKMLAEWRDYDLVSRVRVVRLDDVREPKAVLEDSGLPVTIALGRENFGQHLSNGIKAIVGKGEVFEGVDLVGQNMTLMPRKR